MAIPVATTTIRVLRVPADPTRDPLDPQPAAAVVASGVRAVISTSRGREPSPSGTQEVVEFRLSCDPVEIRHTDSIQDEATGDTYEVVWARPRTGLGLEHAEAGLRQVTGVVSQPNANPRFNA